MSALSFCCVTVFVVVIAVNFSVAMLPIGVDATAVAATVAQIVATVGEAQAFIAI